MVLPGKRTLVALSEGVPRPYLRRGRGGTTCTPQNDRHVAPVFVRYMCSGGKTLLGRGHGASTPRNSPAPSDKKRWGIRGHRRCPAHPLGPVQWRTPHKQRTQLRQRGPWGNGRRCSAHWRAMCVGVTPTLRPLGTPTGPLWPPPTPLHPPCDIPSGCCSFTGPWTVTRSSLRMLRRVAAFCRPLRPVLLLVSFPRLRSPVVGVLGLCWM